MANNKFYENTEYNEQFSNLVKGMAKLGELGESDTNVSLSKTSNIYAEIGEDTSLSVCFNGYPKTKEDEIVKATLFLKGTATAKLTLTGTAVAPETKAVVVVDATTGAEATSGVELSFTADSYKLVELTYFNGVCVVKA